jgi:hypothetical protein
MKLTYSENLMFFLQVVRLKLENDKRIVGTLIPNSAVSATLKCLQQGSEEAEETIH